MMRKKRKKRKKRRKRKKKKKKKTTFSRSPEQKKVMALSHEKIGLTGRAAMATALLGRYILDGHENKSIKEEKSCRN